jgi:hypothetical protein
MEVMMKSTVSTLLITLFLGISTFPLQALVIKITTLRSPTGQLISLLDGVHMDYFDHEATDKQRQDIIRIAQQEGAAIVCEDAWAYEGNNEQVKKMIAERSSNHGVSWGLQTTVSLKKSPKGPQKALCTDCPLGLIAHCVPLKIPTYNTECRHYKDASHSNHFVNCRSVWQSFSDTIDEILEYHDDEFFLHYPKLIYQFSEKNQRFLSYIFTNRTHTIKAMYLKMLSEQPTSQLRNIMSLDLANMGNELVEARILRGISSFKKHKHILVCNGGIHNDIVATILKEHGFITIATQNNPLEDSPSIENHTIVNPVDIPTYFARLHEQLRKEAARSSSSSSSTPPTSKPAPVHEEKKTKK